MVLGFAQIMGMYFTANILTLRHNLPPQNRQIITQLLSGMEFDFYDHWFDIIYLISVLGTAIYLGKKRF